PCNRSSARSATKTGSSCAGGRRGVVLSCVVSPGSFGARRLRPVVAGCACALVAVPTAPFAAVAIAAITVATVAVAALSPASAAVVAHVLVPHHRRRLFLELVHADGDEPQHVLVEAHVALHL